MILRALCLYQRHKKTVRKYQFRTVDVLAREHEYGAPSGARTRDTLIKSQVRISRGRQ